MINRLALAKTGKECNKQMAEGPDRSPHVWKQPSTQYDRRASVSEADDTLNVNCVAGNEVYAEKYSPTVNM